MRSSLFWVLAFLLLLPAVSVQAEKPAVPQSFLPLDDMTEILTDLRGLDGIGVGRVSAWDAFRRENRIPSIREMKKTRPESVEQEMAALGYVVFLPADILELLGVPRDRIRYSGVVDDKKQGLEFFFLFGDFEARAFLKRFPKARDPLGAQLGLVEIPNDAILTLAEGVRDGEDSGPILAFAPSERMLVFIGKDDREGFRDYLNQRPAEPPAGFLELAGEIRPKDAVVIFEHQRLRDIGAGSKVDEKGKPIFPEMSFPQTPTLHCFQTCGILISKVEFLLGETEVAAREIARLKQTQMKKKVPSTAEILTDPKSCLEGIPEDEWFKVGVEGKLVHILASPQYVRHDYLEGWN